MCYRTFIGTIALCGALGLNVFAGEVTSKNADKITISGFTQARGEYRKDNSEATDSGLNVTSAFFVKRSRLTIEAELGEKAWAEAQFDVSADFAPKDALVGLKPAAGWRIRLGQYKRPFSQEELTSDVNTPTIDRGITNDFLVSSAIGYAGRDQGAAVDYTTPSKKLKLIAGVFSGAGEKNITRGDNAGSREKPLQNRGKDFLARFEAQPDNAKRIKFGGGVSTRSVGRTKTNVLATEVMTFTAFDFDFTIEPRKGLSLYGEVVTGDNFTGFNDSTINYTPGEFRGAHFGALYNVPFGNPGLFSAIQPEIRWESFDQMMGIANNRVTQISGGVSLFVNPNLRWRTNVVAQTFEDNARDPQTRVTTELLARL